MEALEQTSLEYTVFYVGYFLDFWSYPHAKTYQLPNIIAVDIEHNVAAIPSTGDKSVSIAEEVKGECHILHKQRILLTHQGGGTKFKVTYDSLDLLRTGKVTELPAHLSLYAHMPKEEIQSIFSVFGIWFHEGMFNLQPTETLNQVFPHIKPWNVKEVLQLALWGGMNPAQFYD